MLKNNANLSQYSTDDKTFFKECLILAQHAYELQEVGCILVFEGNVIGRGHNDVNRTKNPTRHAEVVAIEETEDWCKKNSRNPKDVFKNTILYVTLEPCIMCSAALHQLEIKKTVFGACNPRFGGMVSVLGNHAYNYPHEIEVIYGIENEQCVEILRKFYGRENPFAPEEKRKIKS